MKAFLQILVGLVLGVVGLVVCLNLGLLGNVSSPDWRSVAVTFMLLAATQWVSFFSFRRHIALQVLFGVALCMAIAVWFLYSSFPMFWEDESEPGASITWRSSIAFLILLCATQGISFFVFHWVELIRRRRPAGTGPSKSAFSKVKITRESAKSPQQTVNASKVLVCSLDPACRESFEGDGAIYRRHYRRVDAVFFSDIGDLLGAIKSGYDILHLFSPLAPGGLLTDTGGATLLGTELIQKCCEGNVKVLWVANENKPDDYVKGFGAAGKPLNLIMTIGRNGSTFGGFLEKLLARISSGETLPVARAALAPQAEGPWQEHLPGCIFFAGRAGVRLLP